MFTKALLLLALSLTTLSLPTTNESLEKRSTKAWIGCFEETDEYCQNGVFNNAHPRPKLGGMNDEDCLEFTPTTQRFGMWNHQLPSYLLATQKRRFGNYFSLYRRESGPNRVMILACLSHSDDADVKSQGGVGAMVGGYVRASILTRSQVVQARLPGTVETGVTPGFVWLSVGRSRAFSILDRGDVSSDTVCCILHAILDFKRRLVRDILLLTRSPELPDF